MKPFHNLSRVLTIALAAAALLTSSCKKDNDNSKPADGIKLKKIETSATNYTTFDHNADGKISKMTTVEGAVTEVINLNYQNNRLFTATSDEQGLKFNYANNQLDQVDIHLGDLQAPVASYMKFAYQNNVLNNVITYAYFPGVPNAQPLIKFALEYYPNGDIKAQKDYQWDPFSKGFVLSETTTYEYDTHENPLYALGEIYQVAFEMPSKHNAVKTIHTDQDNNLVKTITYTYTYNTNGYPTQAEKKTIAPGQTNPTVSTVKYTYQ